MLHPAPENKAVNWCEKRREPHHDTSNISHSIVEVWSGFVAPVEHTWWIFSWNFWESLAIHRWSPSNRRFNSRLPVRGEQSTFVRSFFRLWRTVSKINDEILFSRLLVNVLDAGDVIFYSMTIDVREFIQRNIYNLKWNVWYKKSSPVAAAIFRSVLYLFTR